MMYHEATACHVTGDLVELLSIFLSVLKSTRPYLQRKGLVILLFVFVTIKVSFWFLFVLLVSLPMVPELANIGQCLPCPQCKGGMFLYILFISARKQ